MFRKVGTAFLFQNHPMGGLRSIASKTSYSSLLKHVTNKIDIKNKLSALPHSAVTQSFETAIKNADFAHDVFAKSYSGLELNVLARQKAISYEQACTVQLYLLALQEFSCAAMMVKIVENQKLSSFGEKYLVKVCEQFADLKYKLNVNELEKYFLSLPSSEQHLLKLYYNPVNARLLNLKVNDDAHFANKNLYDLAALQLIENIPYITTEKTHYEEDAYYIPSFSFINFLMKKTAKKPYTAHMILGEASEADIEYYHQQRKHPLAVFNYDVKNNYGLVHGYLGGPFTKMLHDLAHWMWANMLADENEIIFKFVAELKVVIANAEKLNNAAVVKSLQTTLTAIIDFNLTPIKDNFAKLPKEQWVYDYLARRFGSGETEDYFYPAEIFRDAELGETHYDEILRLIHERYHSLDSSDENKLLWQKVINVMMKNITPAHRDPEIIAKLCKEKTPDYSATRPGMR